MPALITAAVSPTRTLVATTTASSSSLTNNNWYGNSNDFEPGVTGVSGIAPNILSERLRRLERERVVHAVPYSARPVRMEYALTADGLDLASALRLLADWGGRRPFDGQTSHEALRHDACGTPLEARWYCPTCERSIPDGETSEDRLI